MKRLIFGFIFLCIAIILGISYYLQPDDLNNCSESPSGSGNCQVVDAIVAISGGNTKARVNEAVSLYKNGWSKTIIFSGAAQDKSGPSNALAMKRIAIDSGVSESDIIIDEDSETTKENAENCQKIFTEYNMEKVILVTSGYHQRRANLEFNKYDSDITILNHPAQNDDDWSKMTWWITPRGWWLAVGELVKIAIFYISGISI